MNEKEELMREEIADTMNQMSMSESPNLARVILMLVGGLREAAPGDRTTVVDPECVSGLLAAENRIAALEAAVAAFEARFPPITLDLETASLMRLVPAAEPLPVVTLIEPAKEADEQEDDAEED